MRDIELETMKDVSVLIRTLNEKNKLDLVLTHNPKLAELILTEGKTGDILVRLSGGTTLLLFSRLLEELPYTITHYGWEK